MKSIFRSFSLMLLLTLAGASVSGMVLLTPQEAKAWVPIQQCATGPGAVWAQSNLPMRYEINEAGYSQMPFDQVQRIISQGWAEWGRPCCSGWGATYGGTTTRTAQERSVSDRLMYFRESDWPSAWGNRRQVIAFVRPLIGQCTIARAEMVFNADGFRFTEGGGGTDLRAIVTHEAGHWLGLDHTPIQQATMFQAYTGPQQATLHPDDEEGVCALYPDDCSCTNDSDCNTGQVCLNQVCVTPPCTSDADCDAPDEVCDSNSGDCFVPPCQSDADCVNPGDQCQSDGSCRPTATCPICEPCQTTAECGPQGICAPQLQNRCTRTCSSPADCPGNSQCFQIPNSGGTAICLNPEAASGDVCSDSYVCVDPSATPSNRCDDVVCADGMECNRERQRCERVPDKVFEECTVCQRCSADTPCPDGGLCIDPGTGEGVCAPPCERAADCPGNSDCFRVPISQTETRTLCVNENAPSGGVCPLDYECLVDTGETCPSGQVFNPDTGGCVPSGGGGSEGSGSEESATCTVCNRCSGDSDCESGESCQEFGSISICTVDCADGGSSACPGDSRCFPVSAMETSICLNPGADSDGPCPETYQCGPAPSQPGGPGAPGSGDQPSVERDCAVCASCSADADCADGAVCRDLGGAGSRCTFPCGGGAASCPGNTTCLNVRQLDERLCLNEDASTNGVCHGGFACLETVFPGVSGDEDGCGCAAGAGSGPAGPLGVMLLLGALIGVRRRSALSVVREA